MISDATSVLFIQNLNLLRTKENMRVSNIHEKKCFQKFKNTHEREKIYHGTCKFYKTAL